MPSSYTSNLRLTLPVTGELTATWGDTVNEGITSLLDSAVAGATTVTVLDTDTTLTVVDGEADQSRQMFLIITGTLTAARNIICPANSKLYFIKNSTTGGFAVTLKTSAGTGISVPNGKATALQVVGGNVLDAVNYFSSLDIGTLDAINLEVTNIKAKDGAASITIADSTGVATIAAAPVLTALTASQAVFTNGSKALVSNAITGTGNVVMSTSPTLVTPALGTPSALVGTNITGTAAGLTAGNVTTNANLTGAVTSVGNATSLGSFTSTSLRTALTDETGTGSAVFASSPTLVTPALGTPSALVGTNITGTASSLTAGTVTTNANLTGDVTSVGNATTLTNAPVIAKVLTGYVSGAGTVSATDSILQAIQKLNGNDATNANLTGAVTSVGNATSLGSFTSAQLSGALTDETGTGANVFATSPTLVTPLLGTPTSVTLTNATDLPLTTGVTGILPSANGGTGIATAIFAGGLIQVSIVAALPGSPNANTLYIVTP